MSPQCKMILEHLRRGNSISTLEAMRPPFNCCRLSERLREIEATGIIIDRERVKIGKKHYTRYSYHKAAEMRNEMAKYETTIPSAKLLFTMLP